MVEVVYFWVRKQFRKESRDSAVGTATGYGLDGGEVGVRVPVREDCLLSIPSRLVLRTTQPPIQWILGDLSPRVKRPGREADHSPPTSAQVKNM
jgi:hypothetical protein